MRDQASELPGPPIMAKDSALAPWACPEMTPMMKDGSLVSWTWFGLAFLLFAVEALRPGKFALWLGFAAILVGIVASVARWPWPAELAAFVVFAVAAIPAWRRYERRG